MSNKKKQSRRAIFAGFVGMNRTGKTTIALQIVKEYKKANPKNEIFVFDPQNKFSEYADYIIQDKNDIANLLDRKDALLILDDYQALYPQDSTDQVFSTLLTYRAEHGIDIFFITHHPALIKQKFSYYMSHLFIFPCNLSSDVVGIDKKVPNGVFIESLFRMMDEEINATGGLAENEKLYPNFKHIVYDYGLMKYKTVNF